MFISGTNGKLKDLYIQIEKKAWDYLNKILSEDRQMLYDIVPVIPNYRGIERALIATDFITKSNKKSFDVLLDMYYHYLDEIEQPPSKMGIGKLINFCNELEKHDVMCEIIVYDTKPLTSAYGYSIDFLGIDIVYDGVESLLSVGLEKRLCKLINENGLCKDEKNIDILVTILDRWNLEWTAYYVYTIQNIHQLGDGFVIDI